MILKLNKSTPWFLVYEGDGSGSGAGGAGAGAGGAGAAGGGAAGGGTGAGGTETKKEYTQAEINALMAQNKRGLQDKVQTMTQELEELKKSKNLTEQERETLQGRIDSLNAEWTTKEQQQQTALEKKTKEYDATLKKEAAEKEKWRKDFEKETTRNQILLASSTHKAVSSKQIQDILMPKTTLAEVLGEDGKPTGEWAPRVTLESTDKDGKPVTLHLTVEAAVKHLKESDDYSNLFDGDVRAGLGGTGNNRTTGTGGKAPTDPSAYRAWRKANPDAV